ncbi:hypothetical protein VTN96DRAFT_7740 [Rasamsonia emersonii]
MSLNTLPQHTWLLAILLGVAWLIQKLRAWRARPKLDFPVMGEPGKADYSDAILEGYRKYPDTPFIIPVKPPRVIMPMSTYKDAMVAPTSQLSFLTSVYEMFQGRYTHLGVHQEPVVATIKDELTKSIADILPLLQDECDYAFEKELGRPKEWTPIPVHAKMLRFVATLSGRIFVGLPLSREEEWIQASINYTRDCMAVAYASQKWNALIRPLVVPFLPEVRKAQRDLKFARDKMAPIVADVLKRHNSEKSEPIKAGSRGAFVSWLLNHMPEKQKNAERVGINQMVLSFVSIHSTSTTVTFALFHLATYPEHIEPLREELEQVIKEDGLKKDAKGHAYLTKSSFQKLRKLDSFLKESQRCSPLILVTGARTCLTDYTFSNGVTLPKGTLVAWPLWGVYNSTSTEFLSPEYNAETGNPGPEVFDGFRFARLREIPGREAKHQAVLTNEESLNFGHGYQACPGRFFAVYEIKAIIIEILRNYDIRLKDGVKPKTWSNELLVNPDFGAMIEIKRRET